jgi:ATP-binding cassette subfamily A (ABC1) protein 3
LQLVSNVGAEISFVLPQENVAAFPNFFRELDREKSSMGVVSYGISVTTMEDVFLKVCGSY